MSITSPAELTERSVSTPLVALVESPPEPAPAAPAEPYRAAIRAFGEIGDALGRVKDLDALLHLIAETICALTAVPRCSVYLRDPQTGLFRGRIGHAERDIDAGIKRLVAGIAADGFTREIVETQRPVVVSNALDDPRPVRSAMRAWNVRSMLGVPMLHGGEVIGIIFMDHEDHRQSFTPAVRDLAAAFADLAAVAVAQAEATAHLRHSLGAVSRQNELLRRAAAMDDRLTQTMLQGGNLCEIAEAVAELTGKPTAIFDAEHHRLAAAAPDGESPESLPRLLDGEHRDHPAVADALAAVSDGRGAVVGPLPAAGLHHRFLVAPVLIHDHLWGHLVIKEHRTRFGPLDLHIARRAAIHMALELTAEGRAAVAECDARGSLASELIRGNRDAQAVQRRAQYLGIDLAAPHVVVLFAGANDDGTPLTAGAVTRAFEQEPLPEAPLVTDAPEGVAVLVRLASERSTLAAVMEARASVARAVERLGTVSAAMSGRCAGPVDFARAYAEAQQVMSCLEMLTAGNGERVLTADDLGPGRLFLASSDHEAADRFARDAIGSLLDPDDGSRDLLTTLRTFFDCARSVRRSAVALAVHENTIRYRLTRIEAVTGLAIGSSSSDELTAQLALLVLRLQGALPAVEAGAPVLVEAAVA